jgi:hypothetical protein
VEDIWSSSVQYSQSALREEIHITVKHRGIRQLSLPRVLLNCRNILCLLQVTFCLITFNYLWNPTGYRIITNRMWSFFFFPMARQPHMGLGLLVSSRFHDHTHLRHTTVGRTPLDEGPARRRDLYLTTHNTHKRQTSMPPVGFKPTIPVSERPQTHALDRAATGIG